MTIEQNMLGLEVYKILAAPEYQYQLTIYDEAGESTTTPLKAKWIYVKPTNFMVQLPSQIKETRPEMFFWKTQGEHDEIIEGLIVRLRKVSNQFGVGLTVNDFSQDNTPKQYAKIIHRQTEEEDLNESMMGSSIRSYMKLPASRMVVHHLRKIDPEIRGSRTRNIKEIYIEHSGERYRFPNTNLNAAKAMLRHLESGASFNDKIGNYIISASTDIEMLKQLITESFIRNLNFIANKSKNYIQTLKMNLKKLQGARGYIQITEEILKTPRVSMDSIRKNSENISNKTGIPCEFLIAYSKYDLLDVLKNEKTFIESVANTIPELTPKEVKRLVRMIIRDEIQLLGPGPVIPSGSDIINTISTYAYELSEVLADDLMSVLFSTISLKSAPTVMDAKLVMAIYKSISLNQKTVSNVITAHNFQDHNQKNDPIIAFKDWVNKS